MQSELKPCAHCGGEARLWPVIMPFDADCDSITVQCTECNAIGADVLVDQDVHSHSDLADLEAEAIAAWNTRASDAEMTRLTEALRDAEEQEKVLRGIVNGFIGLVISAGLTEDLVAQVFPDMKRKNGQPASTFAKNARRMVNEARQALAAAALKARGV